MRFSLICVGRLSREYDLVFRHYAALLKSYATLEVIEVSQTPLREGRERVLAREGEALLRRLRTGSFTVVLDREGEEVSSEELSRLLSQQKLHGQSDFQFVLGGAIGLEGSVRARADFTWSLSRLTFPHQLARCLVIEQLYRAVRIERGEPYHY